MNRPPADAPDPTQESGCPPAENLAADVANLLDAPTSRRIADHIRTCQQCAAQRRSLVGWSQELSGDGPNPPARKQLFDRLLGVLNQAAPPQAATAKKTPQEIRDYRLLEELGEGGMGTVYRAKHTRLDRIVALKILSVGRTASPRGVARFEREMKAVGRLDHPNIVRAFDAGEADGMHYLAMELVDGIDLERLVLQQGPLTISDACEIVRQAALGLAHAHQHDLVHRDIKPSNLMLARNGEVKLLDLGLARLNDWVESGAEDAEVPQLRTSDLRLTGAGHFLGTIEFMAPEQAAHSHAVDLRADIYSLGATLFWLLTGEVPLPAAEASTRDERLAALQSRTARRLSTVRPGVPPELDDIVGRMLAADPNDRFATSSEVARVLTPLAASQHVLTLVGGQQVRPEESQVAIPAEGPGAKKSPPVPRWIAAVAAGVLVSTLIAGAWLQLFRNFREPSRGEQAAALLPEPPGKSTDAARDENTAKPAADPSEKPKNTPPPIWSPQPLNEWLASRAVRTVSQEGSGEFRTLQSALDAIQAGQVIQILDQGPYRERLHRDSPLPTDVGLISLVGTRIEIPEWHTAVAAEGSPPQVGMAIRAPDGFRMSGIEFSGPPFDPAASLTEPKHLLDWAVGGDVVIENCRVLSNPPPIVAPPWTVAGKQEQSIDLRFQDAGLKHLVLQDNLIEAQVSPRGAFSGELIVQRNRILGHFGIETPEIISRIVIRHNVIHSSSSIVWRTWEQPQPHPPGAGHLIVNNVLDSSAAPIWVRLYAKQPLVPGPLDSPLTIQGNILRSHWGGGIVMLPPQWEHVRGTWKVSHNCYLDQPRDLANGLVAVPLAASDIVMRTPFLALDEGDPNYYRIEQNGALARAGAGGKLPAYIGALAPGIEPREGDWFSRFRRRESLLVQTTPQPLTVPPPPPTLDMWLPGRKVLKVAQDGSADYATLSAALDSVGSGEVVQILDAGPYRETIAKRLPADTALISTAGAVVELSRWVGSPAPQNDLGASLLCNGDFRLEGIQFEFADRAANAAAADGLLIQADGAICVQHCAFRSRKPPGANPHNPLRALVLTAKAESAAGAWVERCLFEGTLVCHDFAGPVTIRENVVLGAQIGIDVQPQGGDIVLRHNLVANSGQGVVYRYAARKSKELALSKTRLEIHNNTLVAASYPIMVVTKTQTTANPNPTVRTLVIGLAHLVEGPQEVTMLNNVLQAGSYHGIQFDSEEGRAMARRAWQVHCNAYRQEPAADVGHLFGLGQRPGDVIASPLLLSIDPAEAPFGRIAAAGPLAASGAGGAFPDYIGALPPGNDSLKADWVRELITLRTRFIE